MCSARLSCAFHTPCDIITLILLLLLLLRVEFRLEEKV